jgi:hypothetical protein
MIVRYAILVALLVAPFVAGSSTLAATNLTRREIRQMPITERPSRPGHFYGNAVRRNQSRPTGAVVSSGQVW